MSDELHRRVQRLENILLNQLAGESEEENSEQHENFFGLGSKKRAAGGKLKSYTVAAYHKEDPDADIYPAGTFEAANKKEALTQFRNYLRERGDKPSDYKLEAEED